MYPTDSNFTDSNSARTLVKEEPYLMVERFSGNGLMLKSPETNE